MMRTLFIQLLGLAIFCSSCETDSNTCIRVSSTGTTDTRDIKNFKGIVMYEPAELVLTQSPEFSVKLTGPENVVELIKTEKVNDLLSISSSDCFNGSYNLKIEISAPDFELIQLETRGTLETSNTLQGSSIQLELLGDIAGSLLLDMDSVFTTINGRGMLKYEGLGIYHLLDSRAEYTFNGFLFETDHTVINLTGKGVCEAFANDKLDIEIEGSGKIFYKGNPSHSEHYRHRRGHR